LSGAESAQQRIEVVFKLFTSTLFLQKNESTYMTAVLCCSVDIF